MSVAGASASPAAASSAPAITARAKWDYDAAEDNELSFKCGDVISVKAKHNADWWEGEVRGASGYFPANRVEEIAPPRPALSTKPSLAAALAVGSSAALAAVAPVTAPADNATTASTAASENSGDAPAVPTLSVRQSVARLSMSAIIMVPPPPPLQVSTATNNGASTVGTPTASATAPPVKKGRPPSGQGSAIGGGGGTTGSSAATTGGITGGGRGTGAVPGTLDSPIANSLNAALLARISSPVSPSPSLLTPSDTSSQVDEAVDEDGELVNLEPPAQTDIRREGFLSRKNDAAAKKVARTWRQFWVEQAGAMLYFYKEAPNKRKLDKRDPPLSGLDVHGCFVELVKSGEKKKHSFQVVTTRGHIYLFQAQSDADCQAWMEIITEAAANNSKSLRAGGANSPLSPNSRTGSISAKEAPPAKAKTPKEEEPREKRGLFGSKSKTENSKQQLKAKKSLDTTADNEDLLTEEQWRQNAKNKLFGFFKQRPNAESLKERGIIRDDVLLFGGLLQTACDRDSRKVPLIVEQCIQRVEQKGMDTVGIYRLSGNASTIQKLRFLFNEDASLVDLADEQWADINVVTGALKLYFRELQTPLMTFDLYAAFVEAARMSESEARLNAIAALVKSLPPAHYATLEYLVRHLVRVARQSEVNKMEVQNIAIVFGPTLLRPLVDSANAIMNMGHQNTVMEVVIGSCDAIFGKSTAQ